MNLGTAESDQKSIRTAGAAYTSCVHGALHGHICDACFYTLLNSTFFITSSEHASGQLTSYGLSFHFLAWYGALSKASELICAYFHSQVSRAALVGGYSDVTLPTCAIEDSVYINQACSSWESDSTLLHVL
eukprot:scaffold95684_cov18-Tisochrysis_lutea.AAC.1